MALFPNVPTSLSDDKDNEIKSRMENFYSTSISLNQSFWSEADIDTRFESGDQQLINDLYGNLPVASKKNFYFNRIRRIVNMITGHQRRDRKSIVVTPIENGDDYTADQYTKIIMWASSQGNFLETISDSFHGGVVTGMNLLHVWLDFRHDPISGNIKVDNCHYNSFLIDPFFKKPDLSDCNAIWRRTFLTSEECASLLPGEKDIILELNGYPNSSDRGKFQYLPENYNFNTKNLLTYDEFYYRTYRKQLLLVDTQTNEVMEWRKNNDEALKEFLFTYPQITKIYQDVPTVNLASVVQGKVLYNGPNPLGIDSYPFVPVFGYYSPQMPYFHQRIQGVVRGLRDAQYLYNRRRIIELDILESQINSGYIYKENALVNPKDVFLSGQGRGLALKASAQMTDVQPIQPPQVPPSMIQLSELLAKEIQEISGVNEELLGSSVDDKAGILSMLRQGAGLVTLQKLFDQLDLSQKLLGKMLIDVIQTNFAPGKIKRILNEEPAPQFFEKAFGRYDAAVEPGLNTTTQRQMQFAQLLQLREMGVPITDEDLIESATFQGKTKIVENMQKQKQEAQQQQQKQQEYMMQEQQARTNLANARATADEGLGIERLSRIKENEALATERRAEAAKDRDLGLLNLVKALKEIEDVDLMQLEKLINLSSVVNKQEKEAKKESMGEQPPSPAQNTPEGTPSDETV